MNHPSNEQLERHRRGDLPPEELLAVDDHVIACTACRSGASASAASAKALDALAGGAHLTYEELEAYVDGRAGETERLAIERHTAACAACRAELTDLATFRTETAFRADAGPGLSSSRFRLAIAAAVAAAFLGVAAYVVSTTRQTDDRPPAVAVDPGTPSVTPSPVPHPVDPAPPAPVPLAAPLQDVFDALRAGRLPAATLMAQLRPPAGQHREVVTPAGSAELLAPRGVVLEDSRPRFAWTPAGEPLVVEVFDPSFTLVAQSEPRTEPHWTPGKPLPRGTILTWQLTTTGEERRIFPRAPAAPARFTIISVAAAEAIAKARREGQTLQLALLYAREGMHAEAARTFEELAASGGSGAADMRKVATLLRRSAEKER
jgi:anti-sigma factor RsiW